VLKKTITYTNFNDEEVTEDHFFHLSKAELVELEMSHKEGLSEALQKIIAAEDGKAIIKEFKGIILGSYGQRSPDGKRFVKTQELRDEFESSEAYSTLFMELVTNTDAAIEFINGIVPQGLEQDAAKITQLRAAPEPAVAEEDQQLKIDESTGEPRVVTQAEVAAMSQDELQQFGTDLAAGAVKITGNQ
jgi:hypothetical protein